MAGGTIDILVNNVGTGFSSSAAVRRTSSAPSARSATSPNLRRSQTLSPTSLRPGQLRQRCGANVLGWRAWERSGSRMTAVDVDDKG